jgi:predicted  nucleic acid-binding Zn-ribbon protein
MINYKKIHKALETWGKNKEKTPQNSEFLKSEILSKFPIKTGVVERNIYQNQKRLPWLSFGFTALAVLTFIINSQTISVDRLTKNTGVMYGTNSESVMPPTTAAIPEAKNQSAEYASGAVPGNTMGAPARDVVIYNPYYPYPYQQNPNITDTREFSKIYYNSTLQTRKVYEVVSRVETTVRGFGGRVDSSNSGEKSGYISFVIPKNKLESFKNEIESLVGARFYVEQNSTQNMLPQKQAIEQSMEQIKTSLKNLKLERDQIVKTHNQNVSGYYGRIDFINSEISKLNTEYNTANPTRKAEILTRLDQLKNEVIAIQKEITNENRAYQIKKSNIDNSIKYTEENLGYTEKQDENLTNEIETVTGTVSVNWISLWDMADAYLPGALLGWILLLFAVISFFWYRHSRIGSYDYF